MNMLPCESAPRRAVIYIDGLNLYYGIDEEFSGRYNWLDLAGLSADFLRQNIEPIEIKYFTAIIKGNEEEKQRQINYIKALEAHCQKLRTIRGYIQIKPTKECDNCGTRGRYYVEKRTDVNIACEILKDAHLNRFDYCYLVSGDADLLAPIEIIRDYHLEKKTIIVSPPGRENHNLRRAAHESLSINKSDLQNNQLPESITTKAGNIITRPPAWR